MSHPGQLILSPGTRIVTCNDANCIGSGQLIATGAVAVNTESPGDAEHAYKVHSNRSSPMRGCKPTLAFNELRKICQFGRWLRIEGRPPKAANTVLERVTVDSPYDYLVALKPCPRACPGVEDLQLLHRRGG